MGPLLLDPNRSAEMLMALRLRRLLDAEADPGFSRSKRVSEDHPGVWD